MSLLLPVGLTRRGAATLGVAAVGFALAAGFGARSLNAVVLPALVAVSAGAIQLSLRGAPSVTRDAPPDGFVGDRGTVTLTFAAGAPYAAVVEDGLDDGLDGDPVVAGVVGGDPVSYDVEYVDRGERTLGPVRVRARDVLGVVERTFTCLDRHRLLVYPRVRELSGPAREDLRRLYDVERVTERDEFDRLREYTRGDALRDVHWKSSAKHRDLVVTEFATETRTRAVRVTAGAAPGHGDEMAEAAASVCVALADVGLPVALSTPDGGVEAGASRTALLEHLARAGDGRPPESDADVVVEADAAGTTVGVGDVETPFERLLDGPLLADADADVDVDGPDRPETGVAP
jgi:uncharacterized protein (DUF58 family)